MGSISEKHTFTIRMNMRLSTPQRIFFNFSRDKAGRACRLACTGNPSQHRNMVFTEEGQQVLHFTEEVSQAGAD